MEQRQMPRKIRPKYGIDPVQEVLAFSFADTEIERLFNALAPVKGNRDDVIPRLEECAREYRWRRNQNQETPTRAEQNAALREVGRLAQEHGKGLRSLEMRLRTLDMGTEWELVTRSRMLRTGKFTDAIANTADALEDFAQTAKQALHAGQQKSGPRIQTHLHRAVEKLAALYEEFTGKPLSHNPKLLTEYDGEPHSPAGRFIVAFFEIVDPHIRLTSLSTAIASVVKSRRTPHGAATS